jgi:hypothetical protein
MSQRGLSMIGFLRDILWPPPGTDDVADSAVRSSSLEQR